jgi:cellobiose transport system substrate-binding protein
MVGTRRRTGARAVLALFFAGVLAACSSGGGETASQQQASNEPVELTITLWGNFGFKDLYTKYMQEHPNIKIKENVLEFNAAHEQLLTRLAAGSGAPDIAAVDEGFIVQFRSQAQNFVNLLDVGARDREKDYLEWKWKQSLSPDGSTQIGLGTDVGGMGMCYRHDLFKEAGLPTARDEVSQLWPNWNAFIEAGKKFQASGVKAKFADSGTNLYNAILAQQPQSYFDTSDAYIGGTSQGVKTAWDTTMAIDAAGITARLVTFSPEWNAGFAKGSFATLPCPSWMIGHIKQQAPDTAGKWDVAAIPGGGGNWGGSFLTLPRQGKHQKEAWELINWLTQPAQQIEAFKAAGTLPSQPALYTDPALTSFKEPFVNNAPTGEIFSKAAQNLQPQYLGTKNGQVRQAFEQALQRVEQGKQSPADSFAQAVKEGERAAAT